MTVRELMEFLKECDQDSLVVVDGYEGGIANAKTVRSEEVFLDYYKESWYGPHIMARSNWAPVDGKYEKAKVVYLPR
jgi:hypothetical protein